MMYSGHSTFPLLTLFFNNKEWWVPGEKVTQSCPTLCNPMNYSPWNSPGQNTGVGSLSLLQGIFPTQGLNPGLPHCRWILYRLSHKFESAPGVGDEQGTLVCCSPWGHKESDTTEPLNWTEPQVPGEIALNTNPKLVFIKMGGGSQCCQYQKDKDVWIY